MFLTNGRGYSGGACKDPTHGVEDPTSRVGPTGGAMIPMWSGQYSYARKKSVVEGFLQATPEACKDPT